MKGFTFLELMLVISLIALLTALSTPYVSSYLVRNNGRIATDRIVSEIYKAENFAMNNKSISGNITWGICLTGNIVRLFNGSCASPNFREDYVLPATVTVTGLSTITFSNSRGEPTPTSTITVSSGLGSNSIILNGAGMVEVD